MKKLRDGWAEGTHAYHAIREKLRHELRQGVLLIWKQKIWLATCEFLFRDFPVNQFNFNFLHSISTFCTNFVFLHSKNFKFLHCLGLIDMLSANQHGEIFSCILLVLKRSTSRFEEMLMFQAFQQWWSVWLLVKCRTQLDPYYG